MKDVAEVPDRPAEFVEALAKGIAVLECFDAAHPDMTLSEIARRVGLTPAAARRSLITLSAQSSSRAQLRRARVAPANNTSLLTRVANWAGSYVTGEDAVERGVYTTATLRLSRERFVALIDQLDGVVTSFRDDPEDDETLTWTLSMLGASEEI